MKRGIVKKTGRLEDRFIFDLYDGVKSHYCLADYNQFIEDGDVVSFMEGERVEKETGKYKNIPLYVIPRNCTIEMPEDEERLQTIFSTIWRRRAETLLAEAREEAQGEALGVYLYDVSERKPNEDLCKWWIRHRIHRRLWHLDMHNKDIEEAIEYFKCTKAELYDKIVENPLLAVTLDIEKALALCSWFNVEFSKHERETAHIARFIYKQTVRNKHSYVPLALLEKKFLNAQDHYERIRTSYGFYIGEELCQMGYTREVETGLAEYIRSMLKKKKKKRYPILEPQITLDGKQREGVEEALVSPLLILTGGPGRGKTQIINEIVRNLRGRESYVLLSYMGKAVARIRELTSDEHAMTADHFILSAKETPDVIIWDEVSMAHSSLVYETLKKCSKMPRLILVGDPNQLPPIRWGFFFHQLLKTEKVETIHLRHNYRAETKIYDVDENNNLVTTDRSIIENGGVTDVLRHYKRLLDNKIPMRSIIILTTTNDQVDVINLQCQLLNKNSTSIVDGKGRKFIVGDQVILKQNHSKIDLWNGDIGTITDIERRTRKLHVEFKGRNEIFTVSREKGGEYVYYGQDSMTSDSLRHAYCLTIDSSQGSEWPYVIFFVPPGKKNVHFFNFYRINTGVSRTKTKLVILGAIDDLQTYFKLLPPENRERLSDLILQP